MPKTGKTHLQPKQSRNSKRIHSVTIKRMYDESPDTSWLGEYANSPDSEFSIDRAHSEDCQSVSLDAKQAIEQLERAIAYIGIERSAAGNDSENIYWDSLDETMDRLAAAQEELEECDCGERGDTNRGEYRYFNPSGNYKDETPENTRKYVRQDYERMEGLNQGDWCFIGIVAECEYSIGDNRAGCRLIQELSSGGLWGIESDSEESYFTSVEQEELSELRSQLKAIGFSCRAISTAFKNVEHGGDAR